MATMDPEAISAMVVVSAPPYFPAQARTIQRQFTEATLSEQDLEQMSRRHAAGERQVQELFANARALAESYDDVNFTPPFLPRSRPNADCLRRSRPALSGVARLRAAPGHSRFAFVGGAKRRTRTGLRTVGGTVRVDGVCVSAWRVGQRAPSGHEWPLARQSATKARRRCVRYRPCQPQTKRSERRAGRPGSRR